MPEALLSSLLFLALGSPATVTLRDRETIVFFGDSITEQNLYTAYLETFLLSRFPSRDLAVFNFGWGGDTASGGGKRFGRDVLPVQPSLVFVNFGMNDGGYKAFDEATFQTYLAALAALADAIRAAGARQVLLTTSPVDDVLRKDQGVYNDTLSRMARGVARLAAEHELPLIDLLHPMLEVQRRAKETDPAFTMIPDTIHPNAVGHLVMAYLALRQIDAPREVAEVVVEGGSVRARGATVDKTTAADGGVEFDLTLAFLPFYVPEEKPAWMMPALATFEPHARAQRAYADELGRSLRALARPGTYRLALRPQGDLVAIRSVELSPTYPFASFDAPQPPETDSAEVAWTPAPFVDGRIDLGAHYSGAYDVVAYARVVLQADRATTLHLAMGSDDGLAVFLRGERVFAHDVLRGLKPGEDEVELPLVAGHNELIFKMTQAGGDFGLAVEARVRGLGKVEQIAIP